MWVPVFGSAVTPPRAEETTSRDLLEINLGAVSQGAVSRSRWGKSSAVGAREGRKSTWVRRERGEGSPNMGPSCRGLDSGNDRHLWRETIFREFVIGVPGVAICSNIMYYQHSN